jgi:hypothetical protein
MDLVLFLLVMAAISIVAFKSGLAFVRAFLDDNRN